MPNSLQLNTTSETHGDLMQHDCTDWDFVVARAELNGLLVIAENDKVVVQAPRTAADAVLRVADGQDLIDFQADVDALARIRGRMKFQGSADAKVGSLIELAGVGARFSGNVFVGAVEHEIADGNWLTTAEFGLAPDWHGERNDVAAPAAAGRLPGNEGLQIGIATQLDGDITVCKHKLDRWSAGGASG